MGSSMSPTVFLCSVWTSFGRRSWRTMVARFLSISRVDRTPPRPMDFQSQIRNHLRPRMPQSHPPLQSQIRHHLSPRTPQSHPPLWKLHRKPTKRPGMMFHRLRRTRRRTLRAARGKWRSLWQREGRKSCSADGQNRSREFSEGEQENRSQERELAKGPARSPAKEPTSPSSMLAQRADPPPLALEGFMLKKSSGWLTEMQLRFFEVKGGWLRYWWTKREKDEGAAPRREFKLIGLKIERKQGSPKFKLHLPGESQPYSLNADIGSHVLENPSLSGQVHRRDEWVRTLTAHSAYASSARKSRSATK